MRCKSLSKIPTVFAVVVVLVASMLVILALSPRESSARAEVGGQKNEPSGADELSSDGDEILIYTPDMSLFSMDNKQQRQQSVASTTVARPETTSGQLGAGEKWLSQRVGGKQLDTSNGVRDSKSAREINGSSSQTNEPLGASQRSLRPYCVGQRENELQFNWACQGLQMLSVPIDLKPKPTSL